MIVKCKKNNFERVCSQLEALFRNLYTYTSFPEQIKGLSLLLKIAEKRFPSVIIVVKGQTLQFLSLDEGKPRDCAKFVLATKVTTSTRNLDEISCSFIEKNMEEALSICLRLDTFFKLREQKLCVYGLDFQCCADGIQALLSFIRNKMEVTESMQLVTMKRHYLKEKKEKELRELEKEYGVKIEIVTMEKEGMNHKVIIKNLDWSVEEKQLKNKFPKAVEVFMPKNEKGKNKGFAKVTFNSKQAAEDAIKKYNKTEFLGRKVGVEMSHEKNKSVESRYVLNVRGASSKVLEVMNKVKSFFENWKEEKVIEVEQLDVLLFDHIYWRYVTVANKLQEEGEVHVFVSKRQGTVGVRVGGPKREEIEKARQRILDVDTEDLKVFEWNPKEGEKIQKALWNENCLKKKEIECRLDVTIEKDKVKGFKVVGKTHSFDKLKEELEGVSVCKSLKYSKLVRVQLMGPKEKELRSLL